MQALAIRLLPVLVAVILVVTLWEGGFHAFLRPREFASMPPVLNKSLHFGSFIVNPQVFHITQHSFALVNLKPLLPGHVLVSPRRVVPRVSELSTAEVTDLFLTVQRVSRMIERVYNASALNIAIQDGQDAGQSVPHVHAHNIPRKRADLDDRGGTDAIYDLMDGEEGDIGKQLRQQTKFPVPDVERQPRGEAEMRKEASWLAKEMDKEP